MSPKDIPSRVAYAPSIPDLIGCFLVIAVPLRGALHEQDTPAHLRAGEMILQTGMIPRVEALSYTLEGQPLVLSGWLSDVVFAFAERLGGLEAVVLTTTAVLAVAYASLAVFLRRRGVDARISLLAVLVSVYLGTVGWTVRPHVFSYLATALLLWLLERRERGALWQYALLFIFWANLHAGFVYGLVLAGIYCIGSVVETRFGDPAPWRPAVRTYVRGLAVGCLATLVTPYGLGFYTQIRESLADPRLLSEVQEYAPPHLAQPEGVVLYASVAAIILLLALVRKRPAAPVVLSVIAFLYLAFRAQRHVPLFGIVVPPLLALFANRHVAHRSGRYVFGDRLAQIEKRTPIGALTGLVFLLVAVVAYSGDRRVGALLRFDPDSVPVAAVGWARGAGMEGRVFHDPNWGGYLVYAWPEQQAYIHPLRYDLPLVRSAVALNLAAPGWREELVRWDVSIALLAPSSRLAVALAAEPGWTMRWREPVAVVFQRAP